MEYLEFEEICNKDVLDNIIYQYRYLVNFFYKNMNQNDMRLIDCSDGNINEDLVSVFKGFSVVFGNKFVSMDNFIIFIDPNKDAVEEYTTAINSYLPKNLKPTHVCVLSDDVALIEETYSLLNTLNGSLVLVNITKKFNPSEDINYRVINTFGEGNVFSVSNYCEKLYPLSTYPSVDFIKLFNSSIEEIMELSKGKVLIYGGDYMSNSKSLFPLIVTEVFLRDPSYRFYIENEESQAIATKISSYLFKPYMMLVEDVIKFIHSYPNITAEYKTNFMVYNFIQSKNLSIKCSYAPLNSLEKGNSKLAVFNSKDLNIIPFSTYYNLEDKDLDNSMENEKKLRSFIYSLYDVFKFDGDEIIDVTNLFFFALDGIEYVGYNHSYGFRGKCHSFMSGLPAVQRDLTLYDLNNFIFISPFIDSFKLLKVFNTSRITNGSTIKDISAISTLRDNSVAFGSHYVSNTSKDFTGIPNALFCLGMYSKDSYTCRVGLYKRIAEKVGIDKTRRMLDSFGGFNVLTNNYLVLTLMRD